VAAEFHDEEADMKALIVRGGWDGHRPVESTELFLPFLAAHGFEVRIEESPAIYTDTATLAETDLIVQCVTMSGITDDQVRGLCAAVEAGTGLTGWHGGIADSFRASPDYQHLVGGQFVNHPGKPPGDRVGAAEDNFLTHSIAISDRGRAHPITTGLDDFELTTEQYWVLSDGLNDVLATTTHPAEPWQPWRRPVTVPAVWTRQWGAGRVVVSTPGHDPQVLSTPSVRTIIERGMLWASRTASA
jgi:type 1 glutamine amidotransferase